MKRLFLLLLTVLSVVNMYAYNGLYISQSTIGNGMDSQTITSLAKDRLGRLWIGSNVGVTVISNGKVTNIRDMASEGGLVILGKISSIVCTDNALISSEDRILHYDLKADSALTVRFNGNLLHTDAFLLEGSYATFYDNESRALYSYNMENRSCEQIAVFKGSEAYSFSKIVRPDKDSLNLYLADDLLGIFRFNRTNEILEQVKEIPYPINAQATMIDNSNTLWVSFPGNGIAGFYLGGSYEKIAQYNTANCDMQTDDVSLISQLPDGNLIISQADAGVCVINRKINNNKIQTELIDDVRNITSILINPDVKEILFGTLRHGLISMKKTIIGQIRHLHEQKDGIISFENYTSAFEEPDGTVLFGTSGNGIRRVDLRTQQETDFTDTRNLLVNSMCRYDSDRLLISEKTHGLMLFNRKTGKVEPVKSDALKSILPLNKIENLRLASDSENNIFIFNADGNHYLLRQDGTINRFSLKADNDMTEPLVDNVCISPYAIYITSHSTILEIDNRTLKVRQIYKNKTKNIYNITSIAADSQGNLFFSEPAGLHFYDPRSNTDELIVKTWGSGRFMNVAVDPRNRIWFTTTNEYLQMYDRSSKELLVYTVEDGVPSSHFINDFSFCTNAGIILFPNASGVVTIDTNGSLLNDTKPVDVLFISARTEKRVISQKDIANSVIRPFRLPAKFRELILEFSANDFNPIYPHLFTFNIYRNDIPIISVTSSETTVSLPRMDVGTYTVEVQQAYRKGMSDPVKIVSFKIPRPFIGTIPGVLLMLTMVVVFGYSIAKFSTNKEKNKMERAMAAQDIKNREDKIAFLSNIAHELRTPLSLIYNPVKDSLQEKSVDGIDYERMERIFNQVNKMTVMVNMILDSSKADVSKADISIEEVDLNQWLNFLLEDYRIDCYGKGFSLKFLMDNSIGKVHIDKRIIETGLSNMVNNAIKYSLSGTTITVSTSKLDDDTIRIAVKDQGRGFNCDPEDLFKRYYRDNVDKNIPGYGLGLPYARLLLSLVGGTMSAMNNSDGVGSTFYMDFPAAPDNHKSNTKLPGKKISQTEMAANTDEGLPQDFDLANMTVLFVGADDDELQTFTSEFQSKFRLILTANKGAETVNMLKRMNIDIVVSDIDLADTNGFELCRVIKSTFEISHIPVILLTSRSDPRNKDLGYKTGADAFLTRPFDFKQMFNIIRSQLAGRFEIKHQYNFGFFNEISPDQTFSFTDEQFAMTLNSIIREHMSDKSFNTNTVIQKLNISHTLLLKKMDRLLGTNFDTYVMRIKISLVQERLENTDEDLDKIASDTGYANVELMNSSFKRVTGKTVWSIREKS